MCNEHEMGAQDVNDFFFQKITFISYRLNAARVRTGRELERCPC